jgi:hypothetical protein
MNEIMTIVLTRRALCAVSLIVLLAIGAVCSLNPIFEAYSLPSTLIAVAAVPFALLLVAMSIVLRCDSEAPPSNGATDVGLIVDASVTAAEMVMRTLVGGRTKWPRDYFAGQANGNIAGEWARAIICAIARIDSRISVPVAFIVCWSVVLFLGWKLADAFASSTRMYAYAINCGVIASVIVFLGLADTLASELMLNSASRMPRDFRWLFVSTSGVPPLAGNMTTLRGAGVLLARIGDANEPQERGHLYVNRWQ